MRKFNKFVSAVTAVTLASTMAGCSPTIGGNTEYAVTVNGYEVKAGIFIYYTLQAYQEAVSVLSEQNGETPAYDDVKGAHLDDLDATEWIQNKATEYCEGYVHLQQEFDRIGGELTAEELDEIEQMAAYYYSYDSRYAENGVTLETMKSIAESTYKEQAIFEHYYGFDSEKGGSEDDLKDYFDENFARVKYFTISLVDEEGEMLSEDKQRELRKKADDYVSKINKKSKEIEKMWEIDAQSEVYDEYLETQTTVATDESGSTETTTTTTTTTSDTEETTETTTTNPYENERLIQKQTTTSEEESESEETTTTSASDKASKDFNDFVFGELGIGKATVYDYDDETIYVVMRGDLRERMTEEDYWSENYVTQLLQMKYYDEFTADMDEKTKNSDTSRNNAAYRRYAPFKLVIETAK